MRGVAVSGPRRTDDVLFMVASLGQPAATMPQLCPSFEATNDITKAPSSDTNKPVVVSLVAHFDGWRLAVTPEIPKVPSQEVINNLRGGLIEAWRAAACQSSWIWRGCCISSVLGSRDDGPVTKANLGLPVDNMSKNQRRWTCRSRESVFLCREKKKKVYICLDRNEHVKDVLITIFRDGTVSLSC